MPIYEYKCEQGHAFEVRQRMVDDSLEQCTVCEAPVRRVFRPIAVHFKGSGFYNTDYGKQKGKGTAESDSSDSGSSDSGASESGSSEKSSSDKGSSDSGSSEKSSSDKGSSSKGAKSDKKAPTKASAPSPSSNS